MAKVEHVRQRKDGSEVKIVANAAYCGPHLELSVFVYVFRRENSDQDWQLTSDRPHPDWRTMSVEEYIKRGRSEMFRTVTHGEIFAASQAAQALLVH